MSDDGVKLTYEDIRNLGNHLGEEQERLDRELGDLQNKVDELAEGGYQATSSRAFQESYEEFTSGLKQMLEGMKGLGGFLLAAADQFEETDIALEAQARGE
ncbi:MULTISPECIES: WXG100 family type VII secretion target [Streptomyces]|uniref:WXG100 family type VII secretion target n=1 Tax=Streptomyces TaxID=1883 RepID=UPI000CD547CC|nr:MULTISPECIES: WXG100 family type VII secretion target [Streptomyces]